MTSPSKQLTIDGREETLEPPAPSGKHEQPALFSAPLTLAGQQTMEPLGDTDETA